MPQLSEDQKKVLKEHKEEIERRIHRSAAFQRVFRGSDGELALKEIDKNCGYKNDTFNADPCEHAYNAGRRSAAIFIHNVIEQDVDEARKMLDAEDKKE